VVLNFESNQSGGTVVQSSSDCFISSTIVFLSGSFVQFKSGFGVNSEALIQLSASAFIPNAQPRAYI